MCSDTYRLIVVIQLHVLAFTLVTKEVISDLRTGRINFDAWRYVQ